MIHYHGGPFTPRSELLRLGGRHFCVSFADPRDARDCLQLGQSVMWDNGAFSTYTRGHAFDEAGYYQWLEPLLGHPHWAVVPDVIGGTEAEQRALAARWPYPRQLGAPVWHLDQSIDYLLELTDGWFRVCFGSAGPYWQVMSDAWCRRADEAYNALARRGPLPWIHMLRGMRCRGERWPFASLDSASVARNFGGDGHCPLARIERIDKTQGPIAWQQQPIPYQLTIGH